MPLTNTAYLRRRLLADVHSIGTYSQEDAENSAIEKSAALEEIVPHARSRSLMGGFRYEQIESDGLSYDDKARLGIAKTYIERLREKLAIYETCGNREMLVDAFNYLLLEWARPSRPNTYFESTERHEAAMAGHVSVGIG